MAKKKWTAEEREAFAIKMKQAKENKKGVSEVVKTFKKADKTKKKEREEFIDKVSKNFTPLFNSCKKCKVEITSVNGLVYPETKYCVGCYNGIVQEREKENKAKFPQPPQIQQPPKKRDTRSFSERMLNVRDITNEGK